MDRPESSRAPLCMERNGERWGTFLDEDLDESTLAVFGGRRREGGTADADAPHDNDLEGRGWGRGLG
jgi:hypothetical protein